MSSVDHLREFVNERLTAAAEEIFRVFKNTIDEYEEEIYRQRRLLDVVWKPEIKLHRIEFPQQHVSKEEEVIADQQIWIQEKDSSLNQEDPEPPQIKEEQQELCTTEEGEQLVLKQETDPFLLTPTCEENDHSEPEPKSDPQLLSNNSHVAESQGQKGEHEDSGSTRGVEPKSKKRRCKGKSRCDDVYLQPNLLEIHSNTPTGKKSIKHDTGKKPFPCNTCGKLFIWTSALKSHMRSHTGEKPFSCDTCGKRFTRVSTRNTHMKIHTGEKPYLCTTCGKRFIQNSKLKRHVGLHTGKKPCLCVVCGKRFSQMRDLRRHARIHTGEKLLTCKTWEAFQSPSQH